MRTRAGSRLADLLVVVFVPLLSLSPTLADNPWLGPYRDGIALWHLDEVVNGTTPNAIQDGCAGRSDGAVAPDPAERQYGAAALRFAGGSLTVDRFAWRGGDRSLEAFVKVQSYPDAGHEAALFTWVNAKGEVEHSLTLQPDGSMKLNFFFRDHLQEKYAERGTVSTPAGAIPIGRWTHLAVHALGYYNFVRLSVDGHILAEEHGTMYDGDYKLVVGNSPAQDRPFRGWLDELRQGTAKEFALYEPPQTWATPSRPAPTLTDPRFFPSTPNLVLYSAMDGTLDPAPLGKDEKVTWKKADQKPRYGEGLHGQALVLGCPFEYAGRGLLRPEAGTVVCWVKTNGAATDLGRIFKLGDGWGFMISGDHGFYASGNRGVLAGDFWGAFRNLSPQRWHQVGLTWNGEWVDFFFDGHRTGSYLIPGGMTQFITEKTPVGLGDSWMAYGAEDKAFLDEYRLYANALGEEEIANLYRVEAGESLRPVLARFTRFTLYSGKRLLVSRTAVPAELASQTGVKWKLAVVDARGKEQAKSTAARSVAGLTELAVEFPQLPTGDCEARLSATGADGKERLDERFSFRWTDEPWMHEQAGQSDRVLPPWTPVEVKDNLVRVWNREIALDGLALPRALQAGGAPVLASPMTLELQQADGTVVPVKPRKSSAKRLAAAPAKVSFRGGAERPEFDLAVTHELEYDGCSRLALDLQPTKKPKTFNRLTLVIPITKETARFMNAKGTGIRGNKYLIGAVPAAAGRVFGSHILPACTIRTDAVKTLADYDRWEALRQEKKEIPKELAHLNACQPNEMSSGSFMPYLWLGSPERGLCWFADGDQGWTRGDSRTPAVEIVQTERACELRINLVAAPTTVTAARRIVLGLMATPVRPLWPDWRKDYWFRESRITGFGYEFQSGRYYLGKGCPGAYGGEPFPWDLKRAQWYAAISKKKGWLQQPYMEFLNTYADVSALNAEWRQQPAAWQVQGGIRQVQSYDDWFLYHFNRYVRDCNLDGIYLDNVCPQPSLEEYSHGAWRDAAGQLQAGFNLWELRAFMRRLRTVFLDNGVQRPAIQLHMTHANLIPAMAYADLLFDGEDFYVGPSDKDDYLDRWPLDRITAIDSPHTWGVPTLFLGHATEGDWSKRPGGRVAALRAGLAAQLLIDLKGGSWEVGGVYGALKTWGVDRPDCQFVGYWTGQFRSADADVKVAAYRRPDTLVLVVSNFAHDPKAIEVRFTPPADWLTYGADAALAEDLETPAGGKPKTDTREPLVCGVRNDGGEWALQARPIPGRDFRLVCLRRR